MLMSMEKIEMNYRMNIYSHDIIAFDVLQNHFVPEIDF